MGELNQVEVKFNGGAGDKLFVRVNNEESIEITAGGNGVIPLADENVVVTMQQVVAKPVDAEQEAAHVQEPGQTHGTEPAVGGAEALTETAPAETSEAPQTEEAEKEPATTEGTTETEKAPYVEGEVYEVSGVFYVGAKVGDSEEIGLLPVDELPEEARAELVAKGKLQAPVTPEAETTAV